ncbi:hypothetical protein CEXT_430191 [Caerostris extrusa]|uniref:Uncharacterized protein n=1 Tax=Caerostris extrusa TaxID=172846 RepID=A0AAV4XZM5_CAEEX|nr:hypothetical protein CEXT_430191 [Caerostris extrusa]
MPSNVRCWLLVVCRTDTELVDNTLAMECLQYARNGYRNLSSELIHCSADYLWFCVFSLERVTDAFKCSLLVTRCMQNGYRISAYYTNNGMSTVHS